MNGNSYRPSIKEASSLNPRHSCGTLITDKKKQLLVSISLVSQSVVNLFFFFFGIWESSSRGFKVHGLVLHWLHWTNWNLAVHQMFDPLLWEISCGILQEHAYVLLSSIKQLMLLNLFNLMWHVHWGQKTLFVALGVVQRATWVSRNSVFWRRAFNLVSSQMCPTLSSGGGRAKTLVGQGGLH